MTESDWLTSDDPAAMLAQITDGREPFPPRVSDRKLRLFAIAMYRSHYRERWSALLADAATRYAEGEWDRDRVRLAGASDSWSVIHPEAVIAVRLSLLSFGNTSPAAALLRDIVGNPFRRPRPVYNPPEQYPDIAHLPAEWIFLRAWVTPTVLSLAQAAYDDRRPDGSLDPDRLAVLSDALEETGCVPHPLLAHLRSPGPHVRGCWAVDLILSKE